MFVPTHGPNSFADVAFPELDLGDARLDRRFARVVQAALEHPAEPLPDKFHDPAGYVGCLRLLHHPRVTHEALLSCHQVALLERLEAHPGTVLFLHDTTDLDYSGQATLAGALGQIGNGGGQGYLCHNSLAVDPTTRTVFGLACQILHVRPAVGPAEPVARKRARADRESRLWGRGVDHIGPTPAGRTWVHVGDRGADAFEFLQGLADGRRDFVIRSCHDRSLAVDPAAGTPAHLHAWLRAQPAQADWTVAVGSGPGRAARTAHVRATAHRVTVRSPHVRKGDFRREDLTVGAIRVWEPDPPAGAVGLEWVLLTSRPVDTPDRLRAVVGNYECRWLIEEYHKGLKTGAGIEKLQLQDVGSLQTAIAVLSVVAVALVNLRIAGRDPVRAAEPAAGTYVPAVWVRVLSIWRHRAERDLTVAEFTLALARLGGHLNRKADGPPGWLTLWRGWERLHTMLEYELSRATYVEH
jgi:Transposase DNA-binding